MPVSTSPDTPLLRRIGFLLQRAHNAIRERLSAELSGTGLHLGHIAILGSTLQSPGLSQRDVSRTTGIEKSSVVVFIDLLETKGLIRREPHAADRRAHSLYLTDQGLGLLGRIGPLLRNAEEHWLSVLSESEQQALADSLAKLAPLPQ